jgi:hypothetical protein
VPSRVPSPAGPGRERHRSNGNDAGSHVLTAADVEAIAARVVELLRPESHVGHHVDTTSLATILGVSGDWVREHAGELGAIRVGDGPKGALRFEVRRIRAALEQRRLVRQLNPEARRPRATRRVAGVELLPLPDDD